MSQLTPKVYAATITPRIYASTLINLVLFTEDGESLLTESGNPLTM